MAKKNSVSVKTLLPIRWEAGKLNQILIQCISKKILVIGDVGLDRYTIGLAERLSPEAPVPIVLVQEEKLKLGLAANVADNVKALGAVPILVGVIGNDRGAEDFRDLLRVADISDSHLVVEASRRTILKERVVSETQQLLRIDYESPHRVKPMAEQRLLKKVALLLPKVDAVIIEDYAKGLLSGPLMQKLFSMASRAGKVVAVDPNMRTPVGDYRGADILTPNTREAEQLSGILIRDRASLVKAGFSILKTTRSKWVVVTLGKEGMAIFTRGSHLVRLIPTYAREVFDVSGAGDTVIAVLVLALAAGASIEEASVLGNLAAGVEVGKRGTATVSPDEIRAALRSFYSP